MFLLTDHATAPLQQPMPWSQFLMYLGAILLIYVLMRWFQEGDRLDHFLGGFTTVRAERRPPADDPAAVGDEADAGAEEFVEATPGGEPR